MGSIVKQLSAFLIAVLVPSPLPFSQLQFTVISNLQFTQISLLAGLLSETLQSLHCALTDSSMVFCWVDS